MTEQIVITPTQSKYLEYLEDGPKTTSECAAFFGVVVPSSTRILKKLRAAKLVRSSRMQCKRNVRIHERVQTGEACTIVVEGHRPAVIVTDEEVAHVAALSRRGLTGLCLIDEYKKTYPDTPNSRARTAKAKAKARGLCR